MTDPMTTKNGDPMPTIRPDVVLALTEVELIDAEGRFRPRRFDGTPLEQADLDRCLSATRDEAQAAESYLTGQVEVLEGMHHG